MNYKLTKPCINCPFRNDTKPFLTRPRAREIINAIVNMQGTFPCHKTVDYDDDGEGRETPKTQHCAGAMILLEKINAPNQMMRIAERLGMYDYKKLEMNSPIFDTTQEFIKAQTAR